MKYAEINNLETSELLSILADKKKEFLNLRFQQAFGQLSSTASIGLVRKDIARINTALIANKNKS